VSTPVTLQRLARRAREVAEKCDFCSEPIASDHRHVLESGARSVACVCRACALLFANPAASLGKYRLIPDRRLYLADFAMSDAEWASLHVPVGLCFITAGRAYYPGPMGPTEAPVDASTWSALTRRYPLLANMQPELEALLVNRARGHRDYFIAPIDVCFSLVGLIRTRWRGLSGGTVVWTETLAFFESLRKRSRRYLMEAAECPSATT
jgi:hypothetical protein